MKTMKKLAFGIILSAFAVFYPLTAAAEVNISIGIGFPLPPAIVFPGPPQVIILPDTTDVYVAPHIDVDLFFWNGWWWRPWEGGWYRSRYYDRGWAYYKSVPRFYYDVDPRWRAYYRDRNWHGHPWHYQPIPNKQLHQNWKGWRDSRHWEGQRTWNVQGYRPPQQQQRQELRHTRQQEYQQRPEVRRHREQAQQQQQQHRQVQPRQPQQPQDQRMHPAQQPRPQQQQQQRERQVQQQRPQPRDRDYESPQQRPQSQDRGQGQGQGHGRGRGGDRD